MPLSTRLAVVMVPFLTLACSEPGGNLIHSTDRGPAPEDEIRLPEPGEDEDIVFPPDEGSEDPGVPLDPGTPDPGVPHAPIRFVTSQEVLPAVLDLIDGAQSEIRLANLEFLTGSLPDKIDVALAGAKKRGVDIRILLDKDADGNDKRLTSLGLKDIESKPTTSGKTLHVKILVVDRRKVLVGSSNFSTSALKYNNEANWLLDIDGPGPVCAGYVDQLWDDDSTTAKLGQQFGNVHLIGDRQYADLVVPVIAGAKDRIRLAMYQMDAEGGPGDDSNALIFALIAAAGRDVDVQVVLDQGTFASVTDANLQARARLQAGGVDARLDPVDTTTHAKVLVVDDTTVVHSGNWVYTGLQKNHEAGAIVADPALSEEAAAWFDGIWAVSQ